MKENKCPTNISHFLGLEVFVGVCVVEKSAGLAVQHSLFRHCRGSKLKVALLNGGFCSSELYYMHMLHFRICGCTVW